MSLRRTTFLFVFATFLMLALVLTVSLRSLLGRHFRYEEEQQSILNMQRVQSAFEKNYSVLNYFASDWGRQEETYQLVQDGDFQFINEQLTAETYQDLAINIVVIADLAGNVYYAGAYDMDQQDFVRVPATLSPYLRPDSPVFATDSVKDLHEGVIMVEEDPLLTVVGPITGSDREQGEIGFILIGRYFSDTSVFQLAQEVQYPIEVVNYQAENPNQAFIPAQQYFQQNPDQNYYSEPVSEYTLGGYLLIRDINEQPALILRIEQPRTSARNTEILMNYLIFSLVAASLIFAGVFYVLLQNTVLARLFRLGNEVQQIARDPQNITRVTVDKTDELGTLSQHINTMLEALANTQAERNTIQQRLKGVIESMDDIVFTISGNLHAIQFYGSRAVSYGLKDIQLPESVAFEELPSEWIVPHRQPAERALAGAHLVYEWATAIQGEAKHFQISMAPLREGGQEISGIVGVARDVTELKSMEIQLRQRFDELTVLFDASKLFLIQKDVAKVREALCELSVEHFDVLYTWLGEYDLRRKQLKAVASVGSPTEMNRSVQLNNVAPRVDANLKKVLEGKQLAIFNHRDLYPHQFSDSPYWLVLPLNWKGSPRMALCLGSTEKPVLSEQRTRFLRSFGNLAEMALASTSLFSEVEESRQRLQDLSEQLVQVHEEERRWLARELHDEIGQYLTALKLRLDMESFPEQLDVQRIEQARTLVDELISKVRQMSLDLRPSILDDLGLLPALEWLIERYQQQTEIRVDFEQVDLDRRRFSPEIEITAFRIVQEALTNIARYAEVSEARVEVRVNDGNLLIVVRDQGKGFAPQAGGQKGRSSGILGMQERVRLLHGIMQIESDLGSGTEITVELPLDRKNGR